MILQFLLLPIEIGIWLVVIACAVVAWGFSRN